MGQAKARKEEIDALKAAFANRKRKLLAVGAFYKDDQEDGFAICLEATKYGQAAINSVAETIEKGVFAEKMIFDQGSYDYFDGAINKDQAIANITGQLEKLMRIFNTANGIDRSKKSFMQVADLKAEEEMLAAMMNIQLLEQIGALKSDNFNGMLYQTELSF